MKESKREGEKQREWVPVFNAHIYAELPNLVASMNKIYIFKFNLF